MPSTQAGWRADTYPGLLYFETDREVFYLSAMVGNIWTWIYVGGTMKCKQSGIPADLGSNDRYFVVNVTDYRHKLIWGKEDSTVAYSAGWDFESGDGGSNFKQDFFAAPGTGWHLCDGTAGVSYLKSDGTLGSLNLPNLSGSPAYIKSGAAYTGSINSATVPTAGRPLAAQPEPVCPNCAHTPPFYPFWSL